MFGVESRVPHRAQKFTLSVYGVVTTLTLGPGFSLPGVDSHSTDKVVLLHGCLSGTLWTEEDGGGEVNMWRDTCSGVSGPGGTAESRVCPLRTDHKWSEAKNVRRS